MGEECMEWLGGNSIRIRRSQEYDTDSPGVVSLDSPGGGGVVGMEDEGGNSSLDLSQQSSTDQNYSFEQQQSSASSTGNNVTKNVVGFFNDSLQSSSSG